MKRKGVEVLYRPPLKKWVSQHNTMKNKLTTWLKDKKTQVTATMVLASTYYAQPLAVFAVRDAGTGQFQQILVNWLVPWLTQIGGIVMLIGGIQFALAWQRQDSESKSNAMLTVMAGAMVAGLSVGYSMFFTK